MSGVSENDHEPKRMKFSDSKSTGVITEKISPSKANVIRIAGQNYIDTEGGFLIEEHSKPKEKEVIIENESFTEEYKCLQCNREFLSSFLQKSFGYLVCDGCKDSNDKHSLITRTDAKSQYLLKDCDLDKREPPLKFILRKNPHNSNWGQMKLYLHLQVEQRAIEVWGSLEKLEEAFETREEKKMKAKTKRYNKNLKALRMEVRSSIFNKTSGPKHEHEFGPESYNEDEDTYYRTCLSCIMKLIAILITLTCTHCLTAVNSSEIQDGGCTTPNAVPGNCISIRSCPSLIPLLRNATQDPESFNFLTKSKCGGYSEVCCPKETKNSSPSSTEEVCGRTSVAINREFSGVPAFLGAWPWLALLGYRERPGRELEWRCGGTLINKRYVLTAAHCIRARPNIPITLEKVRLGEYNLRSDSDDANPIDFRVEKTIVHYDHSSQRNNIALIRLDKDVIFTDQIKPICLPQAASLRSSTFEGKYAVVVGWGETTLDGPSAPVEMSVPVQVQVPVIDNESCNKDYAKHGANITESQLCAGENKGGKDSCRGDYGGALMLPHSGAYYQIGIISSGYKCAGFPRVYTRVTSYLDWIKNYIE